MRDKGFIADRVGLQAVGTRALTQHQRVVTLLKRQGQAPALWVCQVNKPRQAFTQVVNLLRRIMGITPPAFLRCDFIRVHLAGRIILGRQAPGITDPDAMGQAAKGIPAQVDPVLALRVIDLLLVLVGDRLQR